MEPHHKYHGEWSGGHAARLLNGMPESGGTVLDNSVAIWFNEMSKVTC